MNYQHKQHGVALLVAMVMIFMLSVMGASVMRSSTLEKRMTANAIQSSVTFQAAESASNLTLNDSDNLTIAFSAGLDNRVILPIDEVNSNIGLESSSTLVFVGDGPAEGFSVGIGSNTFESVLYVSTGVSAIETVRSQSSIEQGAYRIVPATAD